MIFGVFLGFQLDRWNSNRIDQLEADEYGLQLLQDLTVSQQEMQLRIDYYETAKEWGQKALTAWESDTPYPPAQLVIAFYQATNAIPSSVFRGAYDGLTTNGLLVLINGQEFASRLAAYYAQPLDDILNAESAYRVEIRSLIPVDIQEAVRESCAIAGSAGFLTETLQRQCQIDISPSRAAEVIENLTEQPELKKQLTYSISSNTLFRYILELKIKDTENLRSILAEIYGD